MEKLTEFVTNSFSDKREIQFFGRTSPKTEPLSPLSQPRRSHSVASNNGTTSESEEDIGDMDVELREGRASSQRLNDDSLNNNEGLAKHKICPQGEKQIPFFLNSYLLTTCIVGNKTVI